MNGLNVEGAVLNKWDRSTGHHDPAAHGEQIQDGTHPKGAVDISRFPMGVVLGPPDPPEPLLISHRYIGFEKGYSALLNSPSTLLLNQNPKVSQIPAFVVPTTGLTRSYEGLHRPTLESVPWSLVGTETGFATDGVYTLVDALSGPWDPVSPKVAMYWGEVDLNFPASMYMVGRFSIPAAPIQTPLVPNGIFTGVGFGVHDNKHLYMVGALTVSGVKHMGLLKDPTLISSLDGWEIGPATEVTITAPNSCEIVSTSVPTGFAVGSRFSILTGTQAGVYTATGVLRTLSGVTEVTVTPVFPADFNLYGNNYPQIAYETDWEVEAATYRLVVDPALCTATVDIAGRISGRIASFVGTASTMPQPAQMNLLLSTDYQGQVFWGSLDSYATSESAWSFLRYGIIPDQTQLRGYTQIVNNLMAVLPEEDTANEWFLTEPFGVSQIISGGGLRLKSTAGSETYDLSYGYGRIEPFLFPEANVDLRFQFRTEAAILGSGDAQVVLQDGKTCTCLATLMYYEGGSPWRQLVEMPSVSMSGFMTPLSQGAWTDIGVGTRSGTAEGSDFVTVTETGALNVFQGTVDVSAMPCGDSQERLGEVEVALGAEGYVYTLSSPSGHTVQLWVTAGQAELRTNGSVLVQAYPFTWAVDEMHQYRLLLSGGVVSLTLDGVLQVPTVPEAAFASGGSNVCLFGTAYPVATTQTRWRSVSYSVLPPATVNRTFGIWLGGDRDEIDSWQIPRTDSSTAANSEQIGPVVVPMDWRSTMEVRLLKTEGWGVTMLRPDLPMPPYYVPETPGVPGSGHATPLAVPSAGWINVQEAELPRQGSVFGSVSFGALDPRAVTQQQWDWVNYKIFKSYVENYKSPEHMVLNQANVVTSGEWLLDTALETATLQVLNLTVLDLTPLHIKAEDVYKIVDGSTLFTRTSWTFDREAQAVMLNTGTQFSSATATVTVLFYPGKPITTTYLLEQPAQDGMTLLNEGTPPVPMSQCDPATRDLVLGSFLYNPVNEVPNFTANDPYKVVTYQDEPFKALYEGMEFMTVTNTGDIDLIAMPDEGVLCDIYVGTDPSGCYVIQLSGTLFSESVPLPTDDLLPPDLFFPPV
jgi:hypothetical protein